MMCLSNPFSALLIVLFCGCFSTTEQSAPSFRVLGGSDASEGEFPWQVSIHKNGYHICGGSIVDKDNIITAAHCVERTAPSSLKVIGGLVNFKSVGNSQVVGVRGIMIHPRYISWLNTYDVAILRVTPSLTLNNTLGIFPINLPPKQYLEPSGRCVSTGWGRANLFGPPISFLLETPTILQKVDITIVPRNLCRLPYLFGATSWLTSSTVCGGGLLKSTCNGDSGGPLVCSYKKGNETHQYLAGITSFGVENCANILFPSVFSNVAAVQEWVDKAMKLKF